MSDEFYRCSNCGEFEPKGISKWRLDNNDEKKEAERILDKVIEPNVISDNELDISELNGFHPMVEELLYCENCNTESKMILVCETK